MRNLPASMTDAIVRQYSAKIFTLRYLEEDLSTHIGEEFTCREIRESCPNPDLFRTQCAAFYLSMATCEPSTFATARVKMCKEPATIKLETPIEVWDDGTNKTMKYAYTVNKYTALAKKRG